MKPFTPTATAVLNALSDGPATAATLRTRIGCGRSTLDKTLADLNRNNQITRLPDDHPDHPSHWTLTAEPTDPAPAQADTDDGATAATDPIDDRDTGDTPTSDTTRVEPDDAEPAPDTERNDPTADGRPDTEPTAPDQATTDLLTAEKAEPSSPAEEIKICRGCQNQMPKICPTCWSKTTSYCGTCRRSMPARGRGTGTPEILANGLPKLTRGQLAELVQDVMRSHPLPDHLGITGWTSGRIAVYLPGRSTGAIGNVLDKLAATGVTEQLGDAPKRYRLCPTPTPAPEPTVIDARPTTSPPAPDTATTADALTPPPATSTPARADDEHNPNDS